jgi:hypothetical protein
MNSRSLCVRDTTVPRFNPPAEPARTVGFGKRDSKNGREREREIGCGIGLRPSVRLTPRFCVLIHRQNRPGQSDGRTDRFCMGEPAQTDGLCIISTNARWSVCLWAVSLSVTVGIKVDIHGYHISLWFSNVFWNIHLELSGTRRFFEVFSPTQTGGSFWFC